MSKTPKLDAAKQAMKAIEANMPPEEAANELIVDLTAGEIYLIGTIGSERYGSIGATSLIKAIKQFTNREVKLFINSSGGSVSEASQMFNAIQGHRPGIIGICDGLAASSASYILMACNRRLIRRNSALMIHEPWSRLSGNADAMKTEAELLARFGTSLAEGYARASGKTVAEIQRIMKDETWFFGREAVDAGFVHAFDDEGQNAGMKPRLRAAKIAALRASVDMALQDCDRMLSQMA